MTSLTLTPPPRETANPAPLRPARSLRRTSSIDVSWPDGVDKDRFFVGGARDIWTSADGGDAQVLAQGRFEARMAEDKTITAIHAEPDQAGIAQLIGARAGGHLRMALREALPDLIAEGHPLYLALDDLSGAALVSTFGWSQWYPDWSAILRKRLGDEQHNQLMAQRANVCWGLKEGNSGLQPGFDGASVASADAGDVRNPADPQGWHPLSDHEGPGFRRVRRIDVMCDDAAGVIRIDSAFQDSAAQKQGGRLAIHEYIVRATVDLRTLKVLTLEPKAQILPFSECPGAIHNTQRLVGKSLADMREGVLEQLRGPEGCTHLTDALRALADVPQLVAKITA